MTLRDRFEEAVKQWLEHCDSVSFSSKMSDYLNHSAYRQLVQLGTPTIPWIIDHYKKVDELPWEFVLQEITGIEMIPDKSRFSPAKVKQQWFEWWDRQQQSGSFPVSDAASAPAETR